jgi:hypothetical protein
MSSLGGGRTVIISFDRRFIFVHLAKTAGDSITTALMPYAGKNSVVVSNDFQARRDGLRRSRYRQLYKLAKHSTADEIRSAVGDEVWNGSYKFAFVRNPIGRAMSLYTFIERKAEERARLLPRNLWYATLASGEDDPANWPAMVAYRESTSFSDFIRHPSALKDQAMHPQSSSLYDAEGMPLVDYVGRVERIDEDFKEIARTIGLPDVLLQRKNESRRTLSRKDITKGDKEHLLALYSVDFVRFGYALGEA